MAERGRPVPAVQLRSSMKLYRHNATPPRRRPGNIMLLCFLLLFLFFCFFSKRLSLTLVSLSYCIS